MEHARQRELSILAAKGRLLALRAVYSCSSGHIGGSLSAMDLLTALYFDVLDVDPARPSDPNRDRFVLSKGHCTPALYSVLALRGFFPVEELSKFRCITGHLSGHAEMRHVPGVDMSTGSLGQGLSAAVGMALAGKLDGAPYRVFAMMGDGELAEGQIWEAALSAAKYKLDNLVGIVDVNGLQIDGKTADVMPTDPLDQKWASFGWNVIFTDGHDLAAIADACRAASACKKKPSVILAKTVKGKGVDFMEHNAAWHGKAPDDAQYADAKAQLEAILSNLEGR